MIWHHPRGSLWRYWKQQLNYGRAEALLERKWPEKYNKHGHLTWSGNVYGDSHTLPLPVRRSRVYHGVWGTAPFQRLYTPSNGDLQSLPLMPEWFLVVAFLIALSALGLLWKPLLLFLPLSFLALGAVLFQAGVSGMRVNFNGVRKFKSQRLRYRLLTTWLHILHPLARLCGRLHNDLTPWRRRGVSSLMFPRVMRFKLWSEQWKPPEIWLMSLELALKSQRVVVQRGGDYDRWDLKLWCGVLGGALIVMTVEEHGSGRQLLRFRTVPSFSTSVWATVVPTGILVAAAGLDQAWVAGALNRSTAVRLIFRGLAESLM